MDNIKKAGLFIQKLFGNQTPPQSTTSGDGINTIDSSGEGRMDATGTTNVVHRRRRHTVQLERSVTGDVKFTIKRTDDVSPSSETDSNKFDFVRRHSSREENVDRNASKLGLDNSVPDNENSDQNLIARAMARNPSFSFENIFQQADFLVSDKLDDSNSVVDRPIRKYCSHSVRTHRSKSVIPAKIQFGHHQDDGVDSDRDITVSGKNRDHKHHKFTSSFKDEDFSKYGSPKIDGDSQNQTSKNSCSSHDVADERQPQSPSDKEVKNITPIPKSKHTTEIDRCRRKKSDNHHIKGPSKSGKVQFDVTKKLEFPTTPEMLLEYHKHHAILDPNEEWLVVELNEYECLIDNLEVIQIIASHSKFFEVSPEELWQEFFQFVEDVPSYDEVINFDVWQEFRDKKYTC